MEMGIFFSIDSVSLLKTKSVLLFVTVCINLMTQSNNTVNVFNMHIGYSYSRFTQEELKHGCLSWFQS